eukprot:gene12048-13679_t
MPSCAPLSKPSAQPSSQPSSFPSTRPSSLPTTFPSQRPSSRPSCQPTSSPTSQPTLEPTGAPTAQPSAQPSALPSSFPSSAPSSFIKEGAWFGLQLGTNSNSDTYYGAVCPTDEICVLVGFNNDVGAVVYTYDRGISWNRTSVGSATLGDVDYFEVSEGSFLYIAVAADALVHKSKDGRTWTTAADLSDYATPFYGIGISKENGTAFAVGSGGFLARSSNSSSFQSWAVLQQYSSNLPDFYDAVSWDGKTLFIVAAQGSIYRSVDGGASLVALSSLSTSSSIYSIASISNGVLMVVGSGNFAARTTDGGNSWVAMTLPAISSKVNNPPHSLVMLSSSVGYCAGTNGKIYMTKNSGHSWEAVVSGSNPFYSLALFSNEVGAAGAGPRSGSASSGGV